MKRIINKQTGLFLRDDFIFDKETEIGLEVTPAQGFYHPKWDGGKWIEGLTEAEITAIKNQHVEQQPIIEEQILELQQVIVELTTKLNDKNIIP